MTVIGVVGGVAGGKSLVSQALRRLGAQVLDADREGHEVLREPEVVRQLVDRWGDQILTGEGQVDRSVVARIVFDSSRPGELEYLEGITHPIIGNRLRERLRRLQAEQPSGVVVLDAPVMIKAGWHELCDHIVFADAPQELRLARALARGWDEADFDAREAAQESLHVKRNLADWVIDNSGTVERTIEQVERFWESVR